MTEDDYKLSTKYPFFNIKNSTTIRFLPVKQTYGHWIAVSSLKRGILENPKDVK